MNILVTTTIAVLSLTGLTWALTRLLRVRICPICMGVGGTWLWMIVAREFGHTIDSTMLALLLGGSVVGVANLMERRLPEGRSPLLWKVLFIPAGFVAAYSLAAPQWVAFAVSVLGLVLLAAIFMYLPASSGRLNDAAKELKDRLQRCC